MSPPEIPDNKTGSESRKNMGIDRRQDYNYDDDFRDDYEEGELTGYMTMQQPGNLNNNAVSDFLSCNHRSVVSTELIYLCFSFYKFRIS